MTLQQLSFFIAIHRYGSFTAAAEELYISQSSISKSMIALEKELGAELFVRSTRKIRLSEMGRRILPHAAQMVQEYEELLCYAAQVQHSHSHAIHIGGVPVLSIYGLTEVIMQFESLHPEFTTDVCEIKTAEILSRISDRSLDVGIVRLSLPLSQKSRNLTIVPLIDDYQVLAVPKEYRPKVSGPISLRKAAGMTFVQINSDPLMAAYHVEQLKAFLPDAPVHLSNTKIDTVKQYILQRGWASLVMQKVAQASFEPEVRTITLSDPLCLTLCAVLRKDEPTAGARGLVHFLKSHFPGQTIFS